MLISLIQDNPGEPAFKTRFRDPALLRSYGYEAIALTDGLLALPAYQTTTVNAPDPLTNDLTTTLDHQFKAALDQGLQVFLHASALVLPRSLVDRSPERYLCQDAGVGSANAGPGRLCLAQPAVLEAYGQSIQELLTRWPLATGLIIRPGIVQHAAHPHLLATALHESSCPNCRSLSLVARHALLARHLYHIVAEEFGKLYVHRLAQRASPGTPTLHDDPALFRSLAAELPASERLIFSFACQQGDGRYGQPFNPCLLAAGAGTPHPLWIEFPCEPEFEGKGAYPNFQVPRWLELFADLAAGTDPQRYSYLAIARGTSGGGGISSGGSGGSGGGGPYPQREEWIDANVFGLAELVQHPDQKPEAIARLWAARCFNTEPASPVADNLAQILLLSASTIHELLYDTVARAPSESPGLVNSGVAQLAPATPWVQHDQLDIEAIWNAAACLLDPGAIAAAIARKRAALQKVELMRQRFEKIAPTLANKAQARDLANSLIFYNSFAGAVTDLFCGFLNYFQWRRAGDGKNQAALARQAADALEHAQAQWQQHTQRHAMLPGAPSVFQENTFWERTNDCLEDLQNAAEYPPPPQAHRFQQHAGTDTPSQVILNSCSHNTLQSTATLSRSNLHSTSSISPPILQHCPWLCVVLTGGILYEHRPVGRDVFR